MTPTYTDSLSADRSVGGGSGPQPEAPGTIWCVLAVRPRAAAASWMHVAGNCPAGLGRCLGVRIQPGSQPFVCPHITLPVVTAKSSTELCYLRIFSSTNSKTNSQRDGSAEQQR